MDPSILAASWTELQEKRRRLLEETESLKCRLHNFEAEPDIPELLAEWNRLEEDISRLQEQAAHHKHIIQEKQDVLKRRRLAQTDSRVRRTQNESITNRRICLAKLERLRAPEQIIRTQQKMIWELEAPIQDVEFAYEQICTVEYIKEKIIRRTVEVAQSHIHEIRTRYRDRKKTLKEALREAMKHKADYPEEEAAWALQSAAHFRWALAHGPMDREWIIRRYRERFPKDDVSDVCPALAITQQCMSCSSHSRKWRPSHSASNQNSKKPLDEAQPWRFWVTFKAEDPGRELPADQKQFVRDLQTLLERENYRNIDPQLTHERLLAITLMSRQERKRIKTVRKAKPRGWKIWRVTREHRLFLKIDEEQRTICFLPCPRKESYKE